MVGELADLRRKRARFERIGEATVELAPPGREHAGVGHVVDERMAEAPLASRLGRIDDRRLRQHRQGVVDGSAAEELAHERGRERHPDDRRDLERRAGGRLECVDPRSEERAEVHGDPVDARRVAELEAPVAHDKCVVLEQGADRLDHEERVAAGALVEPVGGLVPERRPRHRCGEATGPPTVEPAELEQLDVGERRPGRDRAGSRRHEDREGHVRDDLDELVEERPARPVRPMDVVDDDRARSPSLGEPADVPGRQLAQGSPDVGRIRRHERRLGLPATELGVPRDRRDGARQPAGRRLVDVGREEEAPRERSRVRPVLVREALREGSRERVVLAGGVRQVLGPGPREAKASGFLLHVGHQPGFADPGIADHDDHAAASGSMGRLERVAQPRAVRDTADEQAGPGGPDEAMLPLPAQAVDADRLGATADRVLADDLHLEPLACRPNGRFVEEDLARLGQLLEPHRGRHGVAGDHEVRPIPHLADRGHDLARGDPHPQPERRLATIVGDLFEGGCHFEAAEGRAERVVVVRPSSAEHREDRVADELLDGAVISLHGRGEKAERLVDPADDLLGVELGDEARVVDDVGEQRGDDPAVARRSDDRREDAPALVAEPGRGRVRCAARGTTHGLRAASPPTLHRMMVRRVRLLGRPQEIVRTGCCAPAARTLMRAATVFARLSRALAAGPGSRCATAGMPTSPPWRTVTSSGIPPRYSMP